ncbi:hypothetical protein [Shewanella mangrovisoli]|uniref:hypothetical protein n=1 Tax=Shewanella mangrovisoli TaxID=2864211 RepID=UPI0035B8EBBC
MSRKAPGPVFVVPDLPVARYSAEMESCFEMLHRAVSRSIQIPESIESIYVTLRHINVLYYAMRDHFEADDGISAEVAAALPSIEIGEFLKTLTSWEEDFETGRREYENRLISENKVPIEVDPSEAFGGAKDCWHRYRMWVFEATRAVSICKQRISAEAPIKPPRRYEWITH